MTIAFFIVALITLTSAVGVVAFRNPINSALSLVVNLLTVAGLYAGLDAHFLAAVQIIVYAGAIVVLVLFVLMLLNIKVEESRRWTNFHTSVSIAVGSLFLALCVPTLYAFFRRFEAPEKIQEGTVEAIGRLLYSKYLFTFEAASILIMAAIAGAVMLAKRRYRGTGTKLQVRNTSI